MYIIIHVIVYLPFRLGLAQLQKRTGTTHISVLTSTCRRPNPSVQSNSGAELRHQDLFRSAVRGCDIDPHSHEGHVQSVAGIE